LCAPAQRLGRRAGLRPPAPGQGLPEQPPRADPGVRAVDADDQPGADHAVLGLHSRVARRPDEPRRRPRRRVVLRGLPPGVLRGRRPSGAHGDGGPLGPQAAGGRRPVGQPAPELLRADARALEQQPQPVRAAVPRAVG
ncbi:unnamed protein product, partial [Heterosigma akashiwo]